MQKSADAFRTISEVAEDLDLPQHVLRFWESRFPQIRPLKRAGGRRYYRPADVDLLRSIRQLLYNEGYTIKGVQRLLKEQGARGTRVEAPVLAVTSSEFDEGAIEAMEMGTGRVLSPAIPANASPQPSNHDELRNALRCIEECERILMKVRTPTV